LFCLKSVSHKSISRKNWTSIRSISKLKTSYDLKTSDLQTYKMTKEQIIELLQPYLEDDRIFIVEVKVGEGKIRQTITILLDTDEGIKIEECASISRRLAHFIETNELIKDAYNLEVSSPGIDQPLLLKRQYVKNIGRSLKLQLVDGGEKIGALENVTDEGIVFKEEPKKSKGKKVVLIESLTIAFENIKQAKVQISFK
jgi:ribosome maturation factor RimP